jgi:sodium/bile acid cotransporter 7
MQGLTFLKKELLTGFVLFCNMPTTKSSGIAMVVTAGGSFSFALLLAIITNILGVFTIPFMLSALMSGTNVQIDPFPILRDLTTTILLPTLIGKAVGTSTRFMAFLERWKTEITLSTLTANAMVPMLKVSQSADAVFSLGLTSLLGVVALAIGVNGVFLAWHFLSTWALRFPSDIRKSLILMCSQKTLPTAMAVLASLPDSIGNHGTIAIPCILFHFTEVIIGSLIATQMASWPVQESGNSTAALGSANSTAALGAADANLASSPSSGKEMNNSTFPAPGAFAGARFAMNSIDRSLAQAGGRIINGTGVQQDYSRASTKSP